MCKLTEGSKQSNESATHEFTEVKDAETVRHQGNPNGSQGLQKGVHVGLDHIKAGPDSEIRH